MNPEQQKAKMRMLQKLAKAPKPNMTPVAPNSNVIYGYGKSGGEG